MADQPLSKRGCRAKGQDGEREIARLLADLLGVKVKRRVRQHQGDSDLEGLDGWSPEVKRAARPRIAEWWRQTASQAITAGNFPVLFYRLDGGKWRAMWPIFAAMTPGEPCVLAWLDPKLAADSSVEAWASVYRESLKSNGNSNETYEV